MPCELYHATRVQGWMKGEMMHATRYARERPLFEGDLSPQSWLLALLAMGTLVEGWRLAIFAIGRTDRALNAFARAVVDEDGGDDDF